jgi:hypothetical protein
MAITIKSLANGKLEGTAITLYPPQGEGATASVVVKNLRLVNRSATSSVTVALQIQHNSDTRYIGPPTITIPPNGLYVDKPEITLGEGDAIKGTGGPLDYVISGVERNA